jgi:DNA-binding transcriptional MerR regulator
MDRPAGKHPLPGRPYFLQPQCHSSTQFRIRVFPLCQARSDWHGPLLFDKSVLDLIPCYRMYSVDVGKKGAMKIGQLAAAVGVSVQTVRYYERRRLLPSPSRLSSGYRDYPEETIGILLAIKELQAVGFTLREVKAFLQLLTGQQHDTANTRMLVESKLRDMGEQIKRLETMREQLTNRLATCSCCNPAPAVRAPVKRQRQPFPETESGHA